MRHTLLLAILLAGCGSSKPRVVLYCAQDRPFAELVLADFLQQSKLDLAPKYDSEANKSVGLYRELQMEAQRPRCDVHWNNEILTTLMLAKTGIYEAYESPSGKPFKETDKSGDQTWYGFAARARVLLVNRNLVPEAEFPRSLLELTAPRWKGRVAMAKPTHGTTATQAVCLFEVLGPEAAKAFYRGLKANEVKILPGNKQVAEAVGRGEVAVGLTDTDDAMDEIKAGKPVAMIFPDAAGGTAEQPRLGTLLIPNTVAIVKNGPNTLGAKQLIDYLLSPAVEEALAKAGGYQIPLNPEVKVELPAALEPVRQAKPMQVDFAKAADLWETAQAFLRDEFAR